MVSAPPQRGEIVNNPQGDSRGFSASLYDQKRRLHQPILNQTHTTSREKEQERKESEGCVWHYSAAPKIAPWRPGLQLGCHGDRTTGAINRQSAPNLVRLEWGQKEGETDRGRKYKRKEERNDKRKPIRERGERNEANNTDTEREMQGMEWVWEEKRVEEIKKDRRQERKTERRKERKTERKKDRQQDRKKEKLKERNKERQKERQKERKTGRKKERKNERQKERKTERNK